MESYKMLVLQRVLLISFACFCYLRSGVEASHRIATIRELKEVSTADVSNRTGYHFQAFKNWINDPNGPMYYNGIYHLFYQFNPKQPIWGNIIWAHSYSTDLINWNPLEPALFPTKPFDVNGCWSGAATILPGNKPVILYTGIDTNNRQVQNVAFPKDLADPYLREWVKPDYNPVIDPDRSINASFFRDPITAWYGPDSYWRTLIGSKRGNQGVAIMYKSRDFLKWVKVKHPLHSAEGTGMWECPDFFPILTQPQARLESSAQVTGWKHMFKVSLDVTRYEYYTIGTYDFLNDRYVPDGTSPDNNTGLRLDYGNFYASKTFFDEGKSRRILLGWSNESDSQEHDWTKGWAGIHTIPRTLWLDGNGRQVLQWPIEEVEKLRMKEVVVDNKKLTFGDILEIEGMKTAQADVEVTFDVSSSFGKVEPYDPSWTDPQKLCMLKHAEEKGRVGPFGLFVLATEDKRERTSVFFRIFNENNKYIILMCHDPKRSSMGSGLYKPTYGGFVDYDIKKSGGKISLRTLIDHTVVESFGAEGRTCMTSRIYPKFAAGSHARLFAFNNGVGDIKISQLKAWEMRKAVINGF